MDPGMISNLLLGVGGAVGALATYLSASQKRARAKSRQMTADLEEATAYIMASRKGRHVHNDSFHPNGTDAIEIVDLPKYMTRTEE